MNLNELTEGVIDFERLNWFGDTIYLATLREIQEVQADLRKLTPNTMEQVVKMYLLQWGQMARVVNKKDIDGKPVIDWGALTRSLTQRAEALVTLDGKDLLTIDLSDPTVASSIIELYESLDKKRLVKFKIKQGKREGQTIERHEGLGPTCIAKVLHLLNPSLFVMWDSAIRDSETPRPQDYLQFMAKEKAKLTNIFGAGTNERDARTRALRDIEVKNPLSLKVFELLREKTIVKLLDEYEWHQAWF